MISTTPTLTLCRPRCKIKRNRYPFSSLKYRRLRERPSLCMAHRILSHPQSMHRHYVRWLPSANYIADRRRNTPYFLLSRRYSSVNNTQAVKERERSAYALIVTNCIIFGHLTVSRRYQRCTAISASASHAASCYKQRSEHYHVGIATWPMELHKSMRIGWQRSKVGDIGRVLSFFRWWLSQVDRKG